MPRESPFKIQLTKRQQRKLKEVSKRYTSLYRDVIRAKIVMYAANGMANDQIAARLDTSRQIVSKWRKRFFEEGLAGLEERPRIKHPA